MTLLWRATALSSAALIALGATGLGWVHHALAPADPEGAEQIFRVERGETLNQIAEQLAREGLVRDARAVEGLARWKGLEDSLRAGEYRFAASLRPGEMLRRLAAGEVATYEISIPEGFTAAQIARRLEERGFCRAPDFEAAVADPALVAHLGIPGTSLEGYLFPDTYRLPRGLDAREIAAVFVSTFLRVWQELAPLAAARGASLRDVVTLASIVEKETGSASERPLIASVFQNRLRRGMRLESDPTTIYGIQGFDGNLRRAHLDDAANPYNTYRIPGLPPGPIANPGRAALRAVLEPAETPFLYFVSRNDGTHKFSASYQEHTLAVNSFQRRRVRN